MYQVIPPRLFAVTIAWVVISILAVFNWGEAIGLPLPYRNAVLAINAAFLAFTIKPIWRFVWRTLPGLSLWFPDLNGKYDVEIRHNWPIQQRMLAAAAGGDHFDPMSGTEAPPSLGVAQLKAEIDLGFYSVNITMWAEDPNSPGTVIDRSRTLSCSLLRPCDGHPHRLVYVYQQKNRRDKRSLTDDSTFEGAAILDISRDEFSQLRGEYWTNRAWHFGLSTAGTIAMKKQSG